MSIRSWTGQRTTAIREWLADHLRIHHAFIPVGAAWLNRIEGWWRIFRRKAFAGTSLATGEDNAIATQLATLQLNRHAKPWVWARPPPTPKSSVVVLCILFEERRTRDNPLWL